MISLKMAQLVSPLTLLSSGASGRFCRDLSPVLFMASISKLTNSSRKLLSFSVRCGICNSSKMRLLNYTHSIWLISLHFSILTKLLGILGLTSGGLRSSPSPTIFATWSLSGVDIPYKISISREREPANTKQYINYISAYKNELNS